MNYRLVNPNFTHNYINELLTFKGINDLDEYLNPTKDSLIDPERLNNMWMGAQLILNALNNSNKSILIIVDSDNDGFTSAAIIYQYLTEFIKAQEKYNANIEFILHEGKQHGLEDHINFIEQNAIKYSLVIVPDASSNDYEYHERLKNIGIPCLVIDHHLADPPFSDGAVIINNQLSLNYENKALTGAGMIYQFCRYLDKFLNVELSEKYIDLAAWGIIGDEGSLLTYENRYIVKTGLENIDNFFFNTLIDKQSYSMGGKVTPIGVAFYIVPLINAMIRVGSMEEKQRLFYAFIDGKKLVISNKRGAKGELELVAIESARECSNAKSHQTKMREDIIPILEKKIKENNLLDNKILFIRLDKEKFPSELNGLTAMELADKYKKPTIVARLDDNGFISGSARGVDSSPLESFKSYLETTGLFEYAAGHDNAFGISISNDKLSLLHEKANEELKNIDFGEKAYDVNFVREANDKDLKELIEDISVHEYLYGKNIEEPLIYISNIKLSQSDYSIIGKNKDTLKFEKNGITFIRFHAKDLIRDISKYPYLNIEIVGKANINEYYGKRTPQIFINSYELHDGKLEF